MHAAPVLIQNELFVRDDTLRALIEIYLEGHEGVPSRRVEPVGQCLALCELGFHDEACGENRWVVSLLRGRAHLADKPLYLLNEPTMFWSLTAYLVSPASPYSDSENGIGAGAGLFTARPCCRGTVLCLLPHLRKKSRRVL